MTRRSRLRFDDFLLENSPGGRCRAWVQMEWTRGRFYQGEADGIQTMEGEVRATAAAALAAVAKAAGGELTMKLRGSKAIRAFDSWLVVVSVKASSAGETHQLMGAYPCPDDDVSHGAIMAVLDATNRVLEMYLQD